MSQAPMSWIQNLQQTAIDTRVVPLSGFLPVFPWEEFGEKLAALVEHPQLKISPVSVYTASYKTFSQGLGGKVVSVEIEATPLAGAVFLLMGKEDIDHLCSQILTHSPSYKGFSSPFLQEGFYRYLCTQTVALINEMGCFQDLALKIGKPLAIENEDALCIDLEIKTAKRSFFARLLCSVTFHEALKKHFVQKQEGLMNRELLQATPLTSVLSLGSVRLPLSTFKTLRTGDFLLLNSCLWDPNSKKGTAELLLNNIPIFRVRLKEDLVKILNYAIPEDGSPMDENNHESEASDLNEAEEQEFAALESEGIHSDESQSDLYGTDQEVAEESGGLISTKEIPLHLVVEVARMQMTLDELFNLSPGNTLELAVRPEQGVYLTVQGKRVAKGELIRLGDLLGVRILKLGNTVD